MLKVRLLPFGKRQLPLKNEDASFLNKWNIFWLGGDIIEEGLVDFDNGNSAPNPISSDWVEADFGSDDGGKWWVFSENVDGVISARTAYNGEKHTFIDGQIRISTKLTNIFANKDITIDYVVSAIQTMNVENPIKDINNPTWGKLIED